MSKNHELRTKRGNYDNLIKSKKKLDVRAGYDRISKIKKGDTVTFPKYSNIKFYVSGVRKYDSIDEMVENENIQVLMPHTKRTEVVAYYHTLYPKEKESLGIYVLELKKYNPKKDKDIKSKTNKSKNMKQSNNSKNVK